jgi:hypothetical protein
MVEHPKNQRLFRSPMVEEHSKKKDLWDKAAIISTFVSSVVIAGVGLTINASIQEAQRNSADRNAQAQVEVADRNAKLQIDQSARIAEVQRHIQESTLTAQLVEHLASDNPLKRRIAIIALQSAVPVDLYQSVLEVVVKSDPSAEVRVAAIEQVGTIRAHGSQIASIIADTAQDKTKSQQERAAAERTATGLAISSAAPPTTIVFAAAGANQQALADSKLGGGLFTSSLVRGLNGAADFNRDGNVTADELSVYLRQQVSSISQVRQVPSYWRSLAGDSGDIVIFGPGVQYAKSVALVVGNGDYSKTTYPSLAFSENDARQLGQTLATRGVDYLLLINSTAMETRQAMESLRGKVDKNTLFIMYYTGHTRVTSQGNVEWVFVNGGTIPSIEVNAFLASLPSKASILFADASSAVPIQF